MTAAWPRILRMRAWSGLLWQALVLILLLAAGAAHAADPVLPPLTGRVVDAARLIDPAAIQRISDKLAAHEGATSDQVVVATVPKLDGLTIEDYANRLYRRWGLGTKDKNNGALLLIAPTERKMRIEVGYGLEGALTDALTKTIITTAIAPKFRTSDFAGGIEAGIDAIIDVLKGDAEQWQRRPKLRADGEDPFTPAIIVLFVLFIVLIIVVQSRQTGQSGPARSHRTRDGRWITLPGTPSGGFSGGGGSSGGGGASGDW